MSVSETLMRYHLIISKLKTHPASLKEINKILERESEFRGYNLVRDKRTFKRDLDAIRSIYDIDIEFNFRKGVYEIVQDEQNEKNLRIVEALDLFNALKISENISEVIHFEKRRPIGSEHLSGLLHAIKNRVQVKFTYQKYWEHELTSRIAEPYALKEFKNRWYVLANDMKDNKVKSFALDRLTELELTKKKFQYPEDFKVNDHYRYCFGIISPEGDTPTEVILSFDPIQGKYIKSLPLHESQQVLIDNEQELRIQLTVFLTHDFFMELLSHGENLKILKPDSLIQEIKESLEKTLQQY
jgi:predicted DNA-binding transcriptional regulator YafY